MNGGPLPDNPALDPRVAASFARQPLMATLGARLVRAGAGEAEIAMPFAPHITQQNGFVHAGAVGAILDSACGYAALSLMAEGKNVLTVEYKINLLAPAVGDEFRAIGKVVRAGRQVTVTQGEVVAIKGGARKVVAVMQATMMAVEAARTKP